MNLRASFIGGGTSNDGGMMEDLNDFTGLSRHKEFGDKSLNKLGFSSNKFLDGAPKRSSSSGVKRSSAIFIYGY